MHGSKDAAGRDRANINTSGTTISRLAAPSTAYEVRHPMEESREARTAIMTSWPTAMPAMAAELAIPRAPLHQRVTITLTVGIDEPALPRAKTIP